MDPLGRQTRTNTAAKGVTLPGEVGPGTAGMLSNPRRSIFRRGDRALPTAPEIARHVLTVVAKGYAAIAWYHKPQKS